MDDIYEIAFGLILHAGNSRNASIAAVKEAAKGKFKEAREKIKEAEKEMQEAHGIQTTLIQAEAKGEATQINLIMIHAQDHLTMAQVQKETSQQMIGLYEKMEEVQYG